MAKHSSRCGRPNRSLHSNGSFLKVEQLESRTLMSGLPHQADRSTILASDGEPPMSEVQDISAPVVTSLLLLGGDKSIRQIVLRFSEPLDPLQASMVTNYRLRATSIDRGDGLDGTEGVRIDHVEYEVSALMVTIFLRPQLSRNQVFELLIRSTGGIADNQGNPLDGNADEVAGDDFRARFARGKRFSLRDVDGDTFSLRVSGGAGVDLVQSTTGEVNKLFQPGEGRGLVFTGNVRKHRSGDGVVRLEVQNPTSGVTYDLPSSFEVILLN